MKALCLFAAFGLLCAPGRLHAEAAVVEPVSIEETLPTEPHEVTLRVGADWSRHEAAGSPLRRGSQWIQTYWGIAERLSAELRLPREQWRVAGREAQGIGDASAGLKYAVITGARPLVLRAEATLPTMSDALGTSSTALELGASSQVSGERAVLQGGLSYGGSTNGEEREWGYGASLGLRVRPGMHVLVEGAGEYDVREATIRFGVGPAARATWDERWSLGAAALMGVTGETPDLRLLLHLQWMR